ncbi:helix-turn-helix domain-containing protein [Cellulomonas sp. NPDC058312]|uniref:helix-turn-helix domain-containing protein n=1 Tax=Cellulomonas sp. NPDC058312 TaxID=3346441 RepID=UPI0036E5D20F
MIAQTTRLRILSEVARSDQPGPSCEDLRRTLDLSSTAVVSGHVDALEEVGLVVSTRRPERWKRTVQLRDPAAVVELLRAAADIHV